MVEKTSDRRTYRYEKLTWPEIDEAASEDTIVLVPTAVTEQHGPHLPLDTDQVIAGSICEEVARSRTDTLLFPTVTQGYVPHQMDFPGGITLHWKTFVDTLIDVGVSLTHHGFEKVLFVNGHGSNHPLVEIAARQIIIQNSRVHAAMLSWWEIEPVRELAPELRDAGPSGTAHGGEVETSIYLFLHPNQVHMDAAEKDISYPDSRHFYNDDLLGASRSRDSTPVKMMEWFSTISETGVRGDPTEASAEKGEEFFDVAVAGLDSILDEFVDYPIRTVQAKHTRDISAEEYDPFRPR